MPEGEISNIPIITDEKPTYNLLTMNEVSERLDALEKKIRKHDREILDALASGEDLRDKILRKIQRKERETPQEIIQIDPYANLKPGDNV